MKLYLATQNKHKVTEVKAILASFGIEVEMAPDCAKIEPKEWTIQEVASKNAKRLANASGLPTIVDDSGCFFLAYNDFPGALSHWAFEKLGYKGLLKLLEGESRDTVFRCAATICWPGEEPHLFFGEMNGKILKKPTDAPTTTFPYERIFVINGFDVPVCRITKEEKNKHSHRGNAFRKLGVFVEKMSKA
jgi:XTP/dITP diphosphohydrolase